jgi:hypothetical protein
MSIRAIAVGTIKNLLNKDEELYLQRIAICHSCKLLKIDKIFGETCNSTLFLNPNTNEISPISKPGFFHGCGCVLGSKCRVIDAKCPLGKW